MKKHLFFCLATILLLSHAAFGQTTLAKWTFESLTVSSTYTNAGGLITNVLPEIGTGAAMGFHSQVSANQYSTVAGNGSTKSLSSSFWTNAPGDYYQFVVSTISNQNITVTFDQTGSGTGPRDFQLRYSTDGINFTTFTSYSLPSPAISWSTGAGNPASTFTFDLSSVTALNNVQNVYLRLVCASTSSITGATIGSGGTGRIDNFTVIAFNPGPLTFTKNLSNTNTYVGDNLTLSVAVTGSAPITYQWYYPNLSTPLADGAGPAGTISGSATPTLNLTFIAAEQAGNYQVIVSNPSGSITSQVAQVAVDVRPTIATNIAYLRTLRSTNFALSDTQSLFQVEGVVTTPANVVSSPGKSFFVQDATGGMDVFFRNSDFAFPAAGDRVRVTAQLEEFSGLLELHAIATNQTHKIEILSSGNPLPSPQLFTFASPLDPTNMEFFVEGSYVVISNVYLTVTNTDGRITAGSTVMATNLTGQSFKLSIPGNTLAEPIGNQLPGSPSSAPYTIFASQVKGVMTQNDTAVVKTNGYSMYLSDRADITVAEPAVSLSIATSGGNIVVSWPDSVTGYTLETTLSLSPAEWSTVTQPTDQSGGKYSITISGSTGNQFYRLRK